jgi:hypothetical protein
MLTGCSGANVLGTICIWATAGSCRGLEPGWPGHPSTCLPALQHRLREIAPLCFGAPALGDRPPLVNPLQFHTKAVLVQVLKDVIFPSGLLLSNAIAKSTKEIQSSQRVGLQLQVVCKCSRHSAGLWDSMHWNSTWNVPYVDVTGGTTGT